MRYKIGVLVSLQQSPNLFVFMFVQLSVCVSLKVHKLCQADTWLWRSIWFGSRDLSSLGHYCSLVSAARYYHEQTNQTTVLLSSCCHRHCLALFLSSSLTVSSESCPINSAAIQSCQSETSKNSMCARSVGAPVTCGVPI